MAISSIPGARLPARAPPAKLNLAWNRFYTCPSFELQSKWQPLLLRAPDRISIILEITVSDFHEKHNRPLPDKAKLLLPLAGRIVSSFRRLAKLNATSIKLDSDRFLRLPNETIASALAQLQLRIHPSFKFNFTLHLTLTLNRNYCIALHCIVFIKRFNRSGS